MHVLFQEGGVGGNDFESAVHGTKPINRQAGNPQPFLNASYDLLLKARRIVDEYQSAGNQSQTTD
jgi:hypothetical protein